MKWYSKDNGLVLWYTIHRDPDTLKRCIPEVKIGDGYYMYPKRRYQTFYRDFETYEIDEMFLANGYRFQTANKLNAQHNYARLYKKVGSNPLENILNPQRIRKYIKGELRIDEHKDTGIKILKQSDNPVLNDPYPSDMRIEKIYIDALQRIEPGDEYASEYHHLITAILIRLFMPPLQNPKIEYKIVDGLKRLDIVMTNHAATGFFHHLSESYKMYDYILIECKNYGSEIGNAEIDQLAGRLNPSRSTFGILTYRKSKRRENLLKTCREALKNNRRIMLLDDADIISMLNSKWIDEGIDEYLDDRMQDLLLH